MRLWKHPRAIICIWCGGVIPYKKKERTKVIEIMKLHDLTCPEHPLVKRIKELEAERCKK